MARFEWDGRWLDVGTWLTGRYLFLATEEILRVDGVEVLRCGGFGFSYARHAALEHRGIHVKLSLLARVSLQSPMGGVYEVRVDDDPVWRGALTPMLAWRVPS